MADQPQGLFIGLTIPELEAIRVSAIAQVSQGKALMSGSVAGQNFSSQFAIDPATVLIEVRYAISLLTGRGPIRRVRTSFNRHRQELGDRY